MVQNIFEGDLVWVDHEDGSHPGWGLVVGYREVALYDHSANMVDYTVLFDGMVLQLSQTYLKRMCWYNKHLLPKCSRKDGFQKRGT